MPNLSKLMSVEPDKNMMESLSISKSMLQSIPALLTMKKHMENITIKDLYNFMCKKMGNLISYFVNSDMIYRKRAWTDLFSQLFNDKKSWKKLNYDMKIQQIRSMANNMAIKRGQENETDICLIVKSREEIWMHAMSIFSQYKPQQLVRAHFNVNYAHEEGIDGGGLTRDWASRVVKDILDPAKGLFKVVSNGVTMQPDPKSKLIPNYLNIFRFTGRFIAKALISQLDVEVDLTRSLLKHILKKDLYIKDLEDIDPDVAKNLIWMLSNDIESMGELGLNFTTERAMLGVIETIELVPNGKNILVTN